MSRFEHIAPYYEALFPARPQQLDFLQGVLPEGAPARWADVPIGTGMQLEGLIGRGREVWGLDLDPQMIARLRVRRPDLAGRVVEGDMRSVDRLLLPLMGGPAGVVYSIGNSLVQLTGDGEIVEALTAFARLVIPGGALVVQIVNFDRVLAGGLERMPVLERILPDGARVVLHREHTPSEQPGCVSFRTRLETPAGVEERAHDLRALRRGELDHLLQEAGFEPAAWCGEWSGAGWEPGSPATIVTAYRAPHHFQ